jgi:hypothetical protein
VSAARTVGIFGFFKQLFISSLLLLLWLPFIVPLFGGGGVHVFARLVDVDDDNEDDKVVVGGGGGSIALVLVLVSVMVFTLPSSPTVVVIN